MSYCHLWLTLHKAIKIKSDWLNNQEDKSRQKQLLAMSTD